MGAIPRQGYLILAVSLGLAALGRPERLATAAGGDDRGEPRLVRYTETHTSERKGGLRGTSRFVWYVDLRAGRSRRELKVRGVTFLQVINPAEGRLLATQPEKKEASVLPVPRGPAKPMLEALRELMKEEGVAATEVTLDGRRAIRYRREGPGVKTTLWVDPRTGLPVRMEHEQVDPTPDLGLIRSVSTDFEWDPEVEDPDQLFSTEPPEGYSVEDQTRAKK